jgi:hypothetical protein
VFFVSWEGGIAPPSQLDDARHGDDRWSLRLLGLGQTVGHSRASSTGVWDGRLAMEVPGRNPGARLPGPRSRPSRQRYPGREPRYRRGGLELRLIWPARSSPAVPSPSRLAPADLDGVPTSRGWAWRPSDRRAKGKYGARRTSAYERPRRASRPSLRGAGDGRRAARYPGDGDRAVRGRGAVADACGGDELDHLDRLRARAGRDARRRRRPPELARPSPTRGRDRRPHSAVPAGEPSGGARAPAPASPPPRSARADRPPPLSRSTASATRRSSPC